MPKKKTNKRPKRNRPKTFNRDPGKHVGCLRRWQSWLPRIVLDMRNILWKRKIFWDLQELTKENPKILNPGEFFNWMCDNYQDSVTVGARRFTDSDERSHSLWRMLYEILENPGVINRSTHIALYRGKPRPMNSSNLTFNILVGKNKDALSQKQIRSDLQTLEVADERIRRYVNKRVAHITNCGAIRRNPTFNELDKALDTYDKILCKYNTLLTTQDIQSAFDAAMSSYWIDVLLKPWIGPQSKLYSKLKS